VASVAAAGSPSVVRRHWPDYLIEGWALGTFMVSAAVFTTLFEYPASPLHQAIANADLRRACIGLAMGLTAVALIYSPWGKRSGAHMNPAVTLAFLILRKIAPRDAFAYIVAQFVGGALGVYLALAVLGDSLAAPPVSFVQTLPGPMGAAAAFAAEFMISAFLFYVIIQLASRERFASFAGLAAGALVFLYITFEAPLSGMSINPARTFASALPAHDFQTLWIYFTAPVLGMALAASTQLARHRPLPCAKLVHAANQPCIHCGYEPDCDAAA
jgi:aquaporin Z